MQARVHSPECAVRVTLLPGGVLALLAVLLLLPVTGMSQDSGAPAEAVIQPGQTAEAATNAPYVAEVSGNDVRIRSGPGTQFYQCGRLYAGDRVQVVKSEQGWSCIVPPPGCFSWISVQYVSITLRNPTVGIITGDNVAVYTGSDTEEAKYSTSKQVVLRRGQTVKLLGEEKDDYYKIDPPQGAFLWVSSQYLQSVDKPVAKTPAPSGAEASKPAAAKPPADPNAAPGTGLAGLDLYYALSEQVKAEHNKLPAQQDYAEIKKKLALLAADKDAGRAARYAEFTLKQVERYELACQVAKEVQQQNKALEKTTEKIDEARTAKLAQIDDRSKFAIMGKLETSSVYNGAGQMKRYRILDGTGRTVCYVTPTGPAAAMDLSKFIGHKVGLVGKIEPHEATARAFIEFTDIVLLDSES
jgi:uncharacterized protein YraI